MVHCYCHLASRGINIVCFHATEFEGAKTLAVDDEVGWSFTMMQQSSLRKVVDSVALGRYAIL